MARKRGTWGRRKQRIRAHMEEELQSEHGKFAGDELRRIDATVSRIVGIRHYNFDRHFDEIPDEFVAEVHRIHQVELASCIAAARGGIPPQLTEDLQQRNSLLLARQNALTNSTQVSNIPVSIRSMATDPSVQALIASLEHLLSHSREALQIVYTQNSGTFASMGIHSFADLCDFVAENRNHGQQQPTTSSPGRISFAIEMTDHLQPNQESSTSDPSSAMEQRAVRTRTALSDAPEHQAHWGTPAVSENAQNAADQASESPDGSASVACATPPQPAKTGMSEPEQRPEKTVPDLPVTQLPTQTVADKPTLEERLAAFEALVCAPKTVTDQPTLEKRFDALEAYVCQMMEEYSRMHPPANRRNNTELQQPAQNTPEQQQEQTSPSGTNQLVGTDDAMSAIPEPEVPVPDSKPDHVDDRVDPLCTLSDPEENHVCPAERVICNTAIELEWKPEYQLLHVDSQVAVESVSSMPTSQLLLDHQPSKSRQNSGDSTCDMNRMHWRALCPRIHQNRATLGPMPSGHFFDECPGPPAPSRSCC